MKLSTINEEKNTFVIVVEAVHLSSSLQENRKGEEIKVQIILLLEKISGFSVRPYTDEHFVLSRPDITETEAMLILQKITDPSSIEAPLKSDDVEYMPLFRAGGALGDCQHGILLQRAFLALETTNGYWQLWDEGQLNFTLDQNRLQTIVRAALRINMGAFFCFFQPLVELLRDSKAKGTLYGFELLLRFKHGQIELRPAEFLPVAKKVDQYLTQITFHLLQQECRRFAQWCDQYEHAKDLKLHINVEAGFISNETVDYIIAIVGQTGLRFQNVVIELTENEELALNQVDALRQLRRCGLSIAIDDIGMGHSMANLKLLSQRLSEEELSGVIGKLSRELILKINSFGASLPELDEILEILQSLEYVVAEGIEAEILSVLDEIAPWCTKAQGFFFSHPLPPGAISELLRVNEKEPITLPIAA